MSTIFFDSEDSTAASFAGIFSSYLDVKPEYHTRHQISVGICTLLSQARAFIVVDLESPRLL